MIESMASWPGPCWRGPVTGVAASQGFSERDGGSGGRLGILPPLRVGAACGLADPAAPDVDGPPGVLAGETRCSSSCGRTRRAGGPPGISRSRWNDRRDRGGACGLRSLGGSRWCGRRYRRTATRPRGGCRSIARLVCLARTQGQCDPAAGVICPMTGPGTGRGIAPASSDRDSDLARRAVEVLSVRSWKERQKLFLVRM